MTIFPFISGFLTLSQLDTTADTKRILIFNIILILALVIIFTIIVLLLIRHSTHQRVEAERVAAMGTATGRILHQVKNPLQTILLHAEMLADDLMVADAVARREICEAIVGEAARMADLLSRLSIFASGLGQQLIAEPLALHELVDLATTRLTGRCDEAGISVVIGPVEEVMTMGDSTFLLQALRHLLQNAYDALLDRGESRERQLMVSLRRRGTGAVIEVEDTGPGIPAEGLGEIFEPFVTSRAAGLGLGLPMAREIVEGHGGRIDLRSKLGQGTTVALVLPVRVVSATAIQSA